MERQLPISLSKLEAEIAVISRRIFSTFHSKILKIKSMETSNSALGLANV